MPKRLISGWETYPQRWVFRLFLLEPFSERM
nr:MAG TPA: hypothetical protein [Caudoviricetes sp.]